MIFRRYFSVYIIFFSSWCLSALVAELLLKFKKASYYNTNTGCRVYAAVGADKCELFYIEKFFRFLPSLRNFSLSLSGMGISPLSIR